MVSKTMQLGLFGKNLAINSKITDLLLSYGFNVTHFKREGNGITELYFDISQWNMFIDLLDQTWETYLINDLIPLLKKYRILLRFVNEQEIRSLPIYRDFRDESTNLHLQFILETGCVYNRGSTAKYKFEIKNLSKKSIEFKQLYSTISAIQIEDVSGTELFYYIGNELDVAKDIVLKPKDVLVEEQEFQIDLPVGKYSLIPKSSTFKFGKAVSYYTMSPIELLIK